MTHAQLYARLQAAAEPAYRDFSRKLLPAQAQGAVLGVRLPVLRGLAKEIARADPAAFLAQAAGPSFEERMVRGMVIGQLRLAPERVQAYIRGFLPLIDSWSLCDSFCAGLKQARQYPDSYWAFLQPYLRDPRPYARRFGVVLLLDFFLDAPHFPQVLRLLEAVPAAEHTVQMAVAWAASACCARFPQETLAWLSGYPLGRETIAMAVQKIVDSRRVTDADKARARLIRRAQA